MWKASITVFSLFLFLPDFIYLVATREGCKEATVLPRARARLPIPYRQLPLRQPCQQHFEKRRPRMVLWMCWEQSQWVSDEVQ